VAGRIGKAVDHFSALIPRHQHFARGTGQLLPRDLEGAGTA